MKSVPSSLEQEPVHLREENVILRRREESMESNNERETPTKGRFGEG